MTSLLITFGIFQTIFLATSFFCYLPAAMPVINLPRYRSGMSLANPIHIHPAKNGKLLNCMDLLLPKYSAKNPDKIDPIGFEIAPKLAAKYEKSMVKAFNNNNSDIGNEMKLIHN